MVTGFWTPRFVIFKEQKQKGTLHADIQTLCIIIPAVR